jgi:hypothetical protein
MALSTCNWCGKRFDNSLAGHRKSTAYCSNKCYEASKASGSSSSLGPVSGGDMGSLIRSLKYIGIALIAVAGFITILCYKFPKFLYEKNKKFLYAYIITWAVLIAGTALQFFHAYSLVCFITHKSIPHKELCQILFLFLFTIIHYYSLLFNKYDVISGVAFHITIFITFNNYDFLLPQTLF